MRKRLSAIGKALTAKGPQPRDAKAIIQNDASYQYQALSKIETEIRLVELCSSPCGERLCCKIIHAPIGKRTYQALSYVWGSQDKPFNIVVLDDEEKEKGIISLTINLHDALNDLYRTPGINTVSRFFWIDQICINQDDEVEKSEQVQQMSRLFTTAQRVITYLGPGTPYDAAAIDYINQVRAFYEPNLRAFASCLRGAWDAVADDYPLPVPDRIAYQCEVTSQPALCDMVYGEWTRRAWMVQENYVNPDTVFLRGHVIIDWISLMCIPLFSYMNMLTPFPRRDDSAVLNATHGSLWRRLRALYRGDKSLDMPSSLTRNIVQFSGLQCHDPRDRIYAFLAISHDRERLGILPDYTKPAEDVLLNTSIHLLKRRRDLLHFYQMNNLDHLSDTGLPSWVLSSSQVTATHPISTVEYHYVHPIRSTDFLFEHNNQTLVCQGAICGSLTFTTTPCPDFYSNEDATKARGAFSTVDILETYVYAQLFDTLNFNLRSVLALLAVLFPDRGLRLDDAQFFAWRLHDCLQEVLSLYADRLNDDQLRTCTSLLLAVAPMASKPLNDPDGPDKFEDIWTTRRSTTCRKFGITSNDQICNVNPKAGAGDVIALLRGGKFPCVLRPVPGTSFYRFIGDIYLHGIMYGEFYKDKDPNVVDCEVRLV